MKINPESIHTFLLVYLKFMQGPAFSHHDHCTQLCPLHASEWWVPDANMVKELFCSLLHIFLFILRVSFSFTLGFMGQHIQSWISEELCTWGIFNGHYLWRSQDRLQWKITTIGLQQWHLYWIPLLYSWMYMICFWPRTFVFEGPSS